jgi:hypothetical protein
LNEQDLLHQVGQPGDETALPDVSTDVASVSEDFYFKEVIAITLDYLKALQADKDGG